MSAGRPAYGGTPNDASVIDAIRALKARGLNVTVLPFMMMDIPEGNGRPDPYRERAEQAAFPWRGRITSDPAPGCENHLVTTHDLSGWSRSSVTVGTVPGEGLPVGAEAAIAVEDASTSAGGFASCAAAALAGRRVTVSVYVKRQATAAAFPALRVMTRLNTHAVTLRYNPATDSINLLSAGAGMTVRGSGMVNAGGDWRLLWVDLHDPDGTMLRVDLFPAIGLVSGFPTANGAATGSALFLAPQLRPGGGYGPGAYVANAGSNPAAADGTAEARVQVGAFLGAAAAADFSLGGNGSRVNYEGPDEWSYRRFILHHAMLAKAGGADSFLIGSEMVALTRLRDETGAFPFVEALKDLAADCRDILGPDCAIGYAADWSEYHSHRPEDGSGDLIFHLDPLWADENVDFIGVDNYLPLTDWRDGDDHLDAAAGARSLYDQDYLQAGIEGGEYFDWFYASEADRRAQLRTPISDGLGKPWVFRNKDIRSWWDNLHYDRSGAVEKSMPTAWVPRSKPVRFIEFGCPAIDKGANQPNLFIDAKSSESGLPHFSTGARDDAMQRAYLAAMIDYWAPASGHNPTGSYGGPMVDADRMCVWAFDARPFPSFPADRGSWGDAANWVQGHWISGRVMAADLPALVTLLAREYGFDEIDVRQLHGVVDGYRIDRTMSLREALEPLERLFGFDVVETATGLRAVSRRTLRPVLTLAEPQLADVGRGAPIARRRRQETELPQAVRFRFEESLDDYRMAAVEATMALGFSARVAEADMAVVTDQARAQAAAECLLQELWAGREEASFSLPPSLMALETGDVISLEDSNGTARRWRVTRAVHRGAIECEAQAFDGEIHAPAYAPHRGAKAIPAGARAGSSGGGRPLLGLLDLPLPQDGQHESGAYAIAYGAPWPGYLQLYRSADGQGFAPEAVIEGPAAIGETLTALQRGMTGRWDHANQFEVRMISGSLASLSDSAVLAGGNLIAIEGAPDRFELLQFARAELIADNTWRLSRLLRGQFGSDAEMADVIAAGARVVVIDGALTPVGVGLNELGRALSFRAVPPGAGLDSERTATASFTFAGLGLRPLSPVHLRGRRLGNGDIALSWIRRTRLGGDSWHLPDVPLGEASEAYAVRILGAEGEVIREMAATGPALVYPAGLQIEDFGALPPQITVEVAQVSAIWGAGAARREVIHV